MIGSVKVFGIEIAIRLSFLAMLGLITWAWARRFPQQYPDWPLWLSWTIGAAVSLLFFGSLLLHEFAHIGLAQTRGFRVEGIVFYSFGGIFRIAEAPQTDARTDLVIAIVGPLTTLALAGCFALLHLLMQNISQPLAVLGRELSIINLGLAIFNLIPGLPMDGGLILRSLLWEMTQDRRFATEVALWVTRGVAGLVIGGGTWQALTGKWRTGVWLLIVGTILLLTTQLMQQMEKEP